MRAAIGRLRRLDAAAGGGAALEFAFIAPVLCLLLAGVIDLGNVLYVRFRLDSAVSAAANYAVVSAANVSSTGGATLAANLATIVEASQGAGWADTTAVVNDGPSVAITGGATATSGTASAADGCYCPTLSGSTVAWGSATSCGTTCASGATAGKYVAVTASHAYSPLFSSYGVVKDGTVSASAVVRVQ